MIITTLITDTCRLVVIIKGRLHVVIVVVVVNILYGTQYSRITLYVRTCT
jgi:hypothetical protein